MALNTFEAKLVATRVCEHLHRNPDICYGPGGFIALVKREFNQVEMWKHNGAPLMEVDRS